MANKGKVGRYVVLKTGYDNSSLRARLRVDVSEVVTRLDTQKALKAYVVEHAAEFWYHYRTVVDASNGRMLGCFLSGKAMYEVMFKGVK
jgi:hypothetical protein